MPFLKKIYGNKWIWLFAILAGAFFLNNAQQTIFYRPCSVHMWRQTDCASYALNYYQNQNSFLHPQVMSRNPDGGYTVSEFPIIYFFVAKLYSWFGFHDYYIRIIDFSIFIIGLIYITLISSLYIKNKLLQILPSVFTFSSPYIFYYSANFLPDVPALSLSFAGLYHFLIFEKEKSKIDLVISVLFFTLAALLKISSGILWISCFLSFLIKFYSSYQLNKKNSFQKLLLPTILFFFSWAAIFSWIIFAKQYNESHHYIGNLLDFFGIWDADKGEIINVFSRFFNVWIWDVFSKSTLLLFIFAFVYTLLKRKYLPKELFLISIITFIGVHLYSIGWYRAFFHHDYYMINIFCFPILFIICFCVLIEQYSASISRLKVIIISFVVFSIGWGIKHSARVQNFRYTDSQFKYLPDEVYDVGTYLRSIGIKEQEFVISAADPSPNMSLYMMNCVGRTEVYYNDETLSDFKKMGAKYFIANDTANIIVPVFKEFCRSETPIAKFKGILIYKLN